MSHWMSHVTLNESCHTEWVMSHWMSHVTLNESCHTEWVMSHQWMRYKRKQVVPVSSCLPRDVSHLWMIYVTHINKSHHTYKRLMSHMWMGHVTQMKKSCHIYECVTQECRFSPHTHTHTHKHTHRVKSPAMGHVTHMNESCHMYAWATKDESCHDSLKCDVTSHFMCYCDVTHEGVMPHIWMSYGTRMNESWLTCDQVV